MRLLFLGDVVGRPGRRAVAGTLPRLVAREGVGFVVANCENASGGKGIDPDGAEELLDAGVDVLTSGNHVWQHQAIVDYIRDSTRLLRPANFPTGVPGRGWAVHPGHRSAARVGVINVIGRVFMGPADCPFRAAEEAVEAIRRETPIVLVDVHGEATSEKVGMARFLDGRASVVVGSHTHVQTADERLLPKGTAYITDLGLTGPTDSVIGVEPAIALQRFLTQMPNRFEPAKGPAALHGAVIRIDPDTGLGLSIERVRVSLPA